MGEGKSGGRREGLGEEGGTEDGLLTNLGGGGVSQVGHGVKSGREEKEGEGMGVVLVGK